MSSETAHSRAQTRRGRIYDACGERPATPSEHRQPLIERHALKTTLQDSKLIPSIFAGQAGIMPIFFLKISVYHSHQSTLPAFWLPMSLHDRGNAVVFFFSIFHQVFNARIVIFFSFRQCSLIKPHFSFLFSTVFSEPWFSIDFLKFSMLGPWFSFDFHRFYWSDLNFPLVFIGFHLSDSDFLLVFKGFPKMTSQKCWVFEHLNKKVVKCVKFLTPRLRMYQFLQG